MLTSPLPSWLFHRHGSRIVIPSALHCLFKLCLKLQKSSYDHHQHHGTKCACALLFFQKLLGTLMCCGMCMLTDLTCDKVLDCGGCLGCRAAHTQDELALCRKLWQNVLGSATYCLRCEFLRCYEQRVALPLERKAQTSLSTPGLSSVAVPLAACFLCYELAMLVCVALVGLLYTLS